MIPEETTNTDTVIVVEDSPDLPTPVDAGDVTVNVDAPEPSTDIEIDPFTERFVRLEARLEAIELGQYNKADYEDVIAIVDDAVEETLDAALESDDEIVAATDDAIVESIEDASIEENDDGEESLEVADETPLSGKVHPMFRSRKDWFTK